MSNIMGFFYWNSSPKGTDVKINLFNILAVRFCILKRLESIGKRLTLKLIVCSGIFCQTVISAQWWPDMAHAKWLQCHCWTLATDTVVTIYCLWRRRNAVTQSGSPVQSRSSPGKVSDAASHRLSRTSYNPALWENKLKTRHMQHNGWWEVDCF